MKYHVINAFSLLPVLTVAIFLQAASSVSAVAKEKPKKPVVTDNRAEMLAKARRYCKFRYGSDARVVDIKYGTKPLRMSCSVRDKGYKESLR